VHTKTNYIGNKKRHKIQISEKQNFPITIISNIMKADREIKDTKPLRVLPKHSYWYSIETKLPMRYSRCQIEGSPR